MGFTWAWTSASLEKGFVVEYLSSGMSAGGLGKRPYRNGHGAAAHERRAKGIGIFTLLFLLRYSLEIEVTLTATWQPCRLGKYLYIIALPRFASSARVS